MAIPVTAIHILRVLLQAEKNLSGLQRDMRDNAQSWRQMATDQSVGAETLRQYMLDAGASYLSRLGWITTAQADSVNWARLAAMWALLGGTETDWSDMVGPLTAVANGIGSADLSSYGAIISGCDQILALINAPLSLWPE